MLSIAEIHNKIKSLKKDDRDIFFAIEKKQKKMFLDAELAAQIAWVIFQKYREKRTSEFSKKLYDKVLDSNSPTPDIPDYPDHKPVTRIVDQGS